MCYDNQIALKHVPGHTLHDKCMDVQHEKCTVLGVCECTARIKFSDIHVIPHTWSNALDSLEDEEHRLVRRVRKHDA